jgi:pSer/pThr/pTyr-binding forkhead associated (FHA) protein
MNHHDDAPWLALPDEQKVYLVGRMRVGRADHNQVVLADEMASREHAEFEVTEDEVMLHDLGSSNHTFVNEVQLTAPQPLHDGDRIRIGQSTLIFHQPQAKGPSVSGATLLWETKEPLWLVRGDGQSFALTRSLCLGRAADNDLVLEGQSASQHHARIDLDAERAIVTDLGSSNGTWVNGQRISAPHPLRHGDRLQMGDSLFTLQVEGHPVATEPAEAVPAPRRTLRPGLLLGGGVILLLGLLTISALAVGGIVLLRREEATPIPTVAIATRLAPPTATSSPAPTPVPSPAVAELRLQALRAAVFILTPIDGTADEFSTGSGSLLTPAGHILTNFHVIGDVDSGEYYNQYQATLVGLNWEDPEGMPNTFYIAEIVQADRDLDIALLHIVASEEGDNLPAGLEFPTVPVGDSDSVGIGDELAIVGFPGLGGETITLTRGTVSGFLADEAGRPRSWIKTDAEINPGNSGGMAINVKGELIGIPTIVISGQEVTGKIGWIRPIKFAYPLIDQAR